LCAQLDTFARNFPARIILGAGSNVPAEFAKSDRNSADFKTLDWSNVNNQARRSSGLDRLRGSSRNQDRERSSIASDYDSASLSDIAHYRDYNRWFTPESIDHRLCDGAVIVVNDGD
jgi:hypothetical protein